MTIFAEMVEPIIEAIKTGLSSFWVLFSIVLCGGLWGIVGMVICVPLFAVIFDLLRKLVCRGLKRNGRMDLWEEYEKNYGTEPEQPSQKTKTE